MITQINDQNNTGIGATKIGNNNQLPSTFKTLQLCAFNLGQNWEKCVNQIVLHNSDFNKLANVA